MCEICLYKGLYFHEYCLPEGVLRTSPDVEEVNESLLSNEVCSRCGSQLVHYMYGWEDDFDSFLEDPDKVEDEPDFNEEI